MEIGLKVFDTKELPSTKQTILCCLDPNLDALSSADIVELISGEKLCLFRDLKKICSVNIEKVEVASSLIDKKNIYLLLNMDMQRNIFLIGDIISNK